MDQRIMILGGIVLDRYFMVNRFPGRGEDAFFYDEFELVGGCMTNMAVTVKNLGAPVYMVGCIGSDVIGDRIREYISEHMFDTTFLYNVEGATGSCLIFSEPDGERTFIGRNEVDQMFTKTMQKEILAFAPEIVGVTGFYLVGKDAPLILETIQKLHENGSKVLFDPSSLAGDIKPEILREMVRISDYLTPNRIELEMLGGEEMLEILPGEGKTVFYKEGGNGGWIVTPKGKERYDAFPCSVVDTNGAGDSFAGGILYALSKGMSEKEMAELGSRCGAKTCEVLGPHGFWKLKTDE